MVLLLFSELGSIPLGHECESAHRAPHGRMAGIGRRLRCSGLGFVGEMEGPLGEHEALRRLYGVLTAKASCAQTYGLGSAYKAEWVCFSL